MSSDQSVHQNLGNSTNPKKTQDSNPEDQLRIARLEAELAKVKLSALQEEMKRNSPNTNNTIATTFSESSASDSKKKKLLRR